MGDWGPQGCRFPRLGPFVDCVHFMTVARPTGCHSAHWGMLAPVSSGDTQSLPRVTHTLGGSHKKSLWIKDLALVSLPRLSRRQAKGQWAVSGHAGLELPSQSVMVTGRFRVEGHISTAPLADCKQRPQV